MSEGGELKRLRIKQEALAKAKTAEALNEALPQGVGKPRLTLLQFIFGRKKIVDEQKAAEEVTDAIQRTIERVRRL